MRGNLRLVGQSGSRADRQIEVVLVDDHETMRRTLKALLDSEPGIEVIAEAGNLALATRHVHRYAPDVLVLDLRLPDGSSLAAIGELRREAPSTQIVVLTMQESPATAKQALDIGALGFVVKDTADAELADAVRCAADGDAYVSPRVAARVDALRRR
jgi:two-component system, NarL family, response regulator NreC